MEEWDDLGEMRRKIYKLEDTIGGLGMKMGVEIANKWELKAAVEELQIAIKLVLMDSGAKDLSKHTLDFMLKAHEKSLQAMVKTLSGTVPGIELEIDTLRSYYNTLHMCVEKEREGENLSEQGEV